MSRTAICNACASPLILKYTDVRSYVFTVTFVLLSVLVPFALHQFHLAGPTFLPMHIFVLAAGLLFGWRAGLIVGLLTPFTSYAISGMPLLKILPQIMVELSAYGLLAGLLREKFTLPVIWSLLGAMAGGRLAMLLATLVVYLVAGESSSLLRLEPNPLLVLWSVVKQGWPGILIQLGSIPILVFLVERFMAGRMASDYEQSHI